jgi:SHS2 domain-containing protein
VTDRFEFFDHTADIGVHIHGRSLAELFDNAAGALYEALGRLHKPKGALQKTIDLQAESLEDLLHDWLADLLYEIEVNHILYDHFEFRELTPSRLTATLSGGPIDFTRSETNEEIKAVTYHQLSVESQPDGSWRATVIFDV